MFRWLRELHEKWESICDRCGLCCYERERVQGRVHVCHDRPCKFLNRTTGRCNVYERRFRVYPACGKVTIFHALFDKYMPESCAYVKRFRPGKRH